jgi:hypothetical protein
MNLPLFPMFAGDARKVFNSDTETSLSNEDSTSIASTIKDAILNVDMCIDRHNQVYTIKVALGLSFFGCFLLIMSLLAGFLWYRHKFHRFYHNINERQPIYIGQEMPEVDLEAVNRPNQAVDLQVANNAQPDDLIIVNNQNLNRHPNARISVLVGEMFPLNMPDHRNLTALKQYQKLQRDHLKAFQTYEEVRFRAGERV